MSTTSPSATLAGPTCDLKTYRKLASQANWIPAWTSIPADLLTPVSAFWKLTHQRGAGKKRSEQAERESYSFLFESVEGGESVARFTFLGTGLGIGSRKHGQGAAFPLIVKYWVPSEPKSGAAGKVE